MFFNGMQMEPVVEGRQLPFTGLTGLNGLNGLTGSLPLRLTVISKIRQIQTLKQLQRIYCGRTSAAGQSYLPGINDKIKDVQNVHSMYYIQSGIKKIILHYNSPLKVSFTNKPKTKNMNLDILMNNHLFFISVNQHDEHSIVDEQPNTASLYAPAKPSYSPSVSNSVAPAYETSFSNSDSFTSSVSKPKPLESERKTSRFTTPKSNYQSYG